MSVIEELWVCEFVGVELRAWFGGWDDVCFFGWDVSFGYGG